MSVAVSVLLLYETVAATVPPEPLLSVKSPVVIEEASIAWLKVAVTAALVATPVAPAAGLSPVTAGAGPVVNDQLTVPDIGMPELLSAPLMLAV